MRAAGMTLIEVSVSILLVTVVILGALMVRYHAVKQAVRGDAYETAARVGQLLLEGWRSTEWNVYDPNDRFPDQLMFQEAIDGPDVTADGFTRTQAPAASRYYEAILNNRHYYATLGYMAPVGTSGCGEAAGHPRQRGVLEQLRRVGHRRQHQLRKADQPKMKKKARNPNVEFEFSFDRCKGRPRMRRRRGVRRVASGLTLVEMMTAMLASSIMFLAVAGVLAGNHKQWNQTYDRVNGEVVTEAYVTRITFDRIVRQASAYWCTPMYAVESSITLQLYTNIENMGTTPALNRYARFTPQRHGSGPGAGPALGSGALGVPGSPDSTQVLAHNVTIARFWRSGPCVHMALLIDDGHTQMPVTMTATRYNP